MNGSAIDQANRDPLLGVVAGADGLKTGHTEEAGYSFVGSAIQNGRRLGDGGRRVHRLQPAQGRIGQVHEMGFGAWQSHPIVAKGKQIATAEVQLGSSSSVGLVAADNLAMTVPSGTTPNTNAKVVYDGPLKAPIKAGDHVADLIVTSPGMPDQRFPLVADKDVGRAGFFGRASTGLMQLFGG